VVKQVVATAVKPTADAVKGAVGDVANTANAAVQKVATVTPELIEKLNKLKLPKETVEKLTKSGLPAQILEKVANGEVPVDKVDQLLKEAAELGKALEKELVKEVQQVKVAGIVQQVKQAADLKKLQEVVQLDQILKSQAQENALLKQTLALLVGTLGRTGGAVQQLGGGALNGALQLGGGALNGLQQLTGGALNGALNVGGGALQGAAQAVNQVQQLVGLEKALGAAQRQKQGGLGGLFNLGGLLGGGRRAPAVSARLVV
jgi:hypothetical protein